MCKVLARETRHFIRKSRIFCNHFKMSNFLKNTKSVIQKRNPYFRFNKNLREIKQAASLV